MLISNHISWLDIMAVNGAFPGRFVAKDDVAKWPVVGYLATQAQTVYVSRNRGIKGNSAKIAGVTEALKNGDTVTIFPEGTRNTDENEILLPFKSGIYHLAKSKPDTEFVPIWIDNINRVLPKGKVLPVPLRCDENRQNHRNPQPLTLHEDEDKDTFLTRTREALLALRSSENECNEFRQNERSGFRQNECNESQQNKGAAS